jgi:hypothetical protein
MKDSKKIIISHPMGNMNTRAAAIGLRKKGLLYKFYTCIACFENSLLYKLASLPFLKEFRRRLFDSSLEKVTHTFPWRELGRQISIKFKFKHLLKHEKGYFCVDKICRNFDKQVSRDIKNDNINAVYAYEDCALLTFRSAKKQNKYCIYDLPIGHWRSMRQLLSIEQERSPQWAITLGGFNDSDEKLKCKDEELSLADKIYVASTFTKKNFRTLSG